MKLLFLTPNFLNYTASLYQFNTYKYLERYCQLILWGPGFKDFDQNLSLSEVILKFKLTQRDAICVGHGWLSDLPLGESLKDVSIRVKKFLDDLPDQGKILVVSHGNTIRAISVLLGINSESEVSSYEIKTGTYLLVE